MKKIFSKLGDLPFTGPLTYPIVLAAGLYLAFRLGIDLPGRYVGAELSRTIICSSAWALATAIVHRIMVRKGLWKNVFIVVYPTLFFSILLVSIAGHPGMFFWGLILGTVVWLDIRQEKKRRKKSD